MKKNILLVMCLLLGGIVSAQSEPDAYRLSQRNNLLGTARYMSMGGAFGALGGDITTLTENPGGIGVYRSSEVILTPNVSIVPLSATVGDLSRKETKYNFFVNNVGIVGTFNFAKKNPDVVFKNFNIGASFNRIKNFNRNVTVAGGQNPRSLSQYIVNNTNLGGISSELLGDDYPFDTGAPWLSALAYQSYMMDPVGGNNEEGFQYQYVNNLTADGSMQSSSYEAWERGYIDEYDFSLGGNVADIFHFGLTWGISSVRYELDSEYKEAYTAGASMYMKNYLLTRGYGMNLKLGVIVTPTSFLRLGFAFHTPTTYFLNDRFYADMNTSADPENLTIETPDSYAAAYRIQTPWKIIGSAAFVIGTRGLISFDYTLEDFSTMKLGDSSGRMSDYQLVNEQMKNHYKAVHTFKAGGEFRVIDGFALRVGFATSGPAVKKNVEANNDIILVAGTVPQYSFDQRTFYYTGGLGYRTNRFSIDLAYVMRDHRETLYMFPNYPSTPEIQSGLVPVKLRSKTSNIVLTAGFRF